VRILVALAMRKPFEDYGAPAAGPFCGRKFCAGPKSFKVATGYGKTERKPELAVELHQKAVQKRSKNTSPNLISNQYSQRESERFEKESR